jgi:hypothetical protein
MFTVVRTAEAMPGKVLDAITWGKNVAAIAERALGHEVTFSVAFGGHQAEVAWISKFDSAAELDEVPAKLMAYPGYVEAIKKAETLTVPGTQRDHFWRTM